jgi:hypothetical protein
MIIVVDQRVLYGPDSESYHLTAAASLYFRSKLVWHPRQGRGRPVHPRIPVFHRREILLVRQTARPTIIYCITVSVDSLFLSRHFYFCDTYLRRPGRRGARGFGGGRRGNTGGLILSTGQIGVG